MRKPIRMDGAVRRVLWIPVIAALFACGPPPALRPHVIRLPLREFPTPVAADVQIPARKSYARVPLIVILDDGPPVDPDRTRSQGKRIGRLQEILRGKGYAVWRPLRDTWPADSLIVRCPDEVSALVQLGLRSALALAITDTSRVVLVGFGQGGVIAGMVAQRMGAAVHAVGIVGTPARSIDRVLTTSPLRDSVAVARMRRVFNGIRGGAYADSEMVLSGRATCWRSWLALTEAMPEIVGALPQPALAVQGTADDLLPLLDIERFRSAIGRRPLSRAVSVIGMKHGLSDEHPTPKQPPDAINPEFVSVIMEWLLEAAPLPKAD